MTSTAVMLCSAVGAYLAVLTGAALVGSARLRVGASDGVSRFVVLVPAHNEQRLIESTIAQLVALNYPSDMFAVHVVADHCADATVDLARRAGACVHEHVDPNVPGKGAALRWLIDRLWSNGELDIDDIVVIIDADTSADRALLRSLDDRFAIGADVVQAHYSVRSPEVSTAAALRSAALAARHYLRPLGRTTLGASSGLFGNGMAFRSSVLRSVEVGDHLTEDLEMSCELTLNGVAIAFASDAVVEAEMPDTIEASVTQHERWERGRLDVAQRFASRLVLSAFRPSATPRRLARLDAAADLLVPPLSVVVAASSLTTALSAAALLGSRPSRGDRVRAAVAAITSLTLAAHVFIALRLVRAPATVYRALLSAPQLVVWKLRLWGRMLFAANDVSWTRTERNVPTQAGRASTAFDLTDRG